MVGSLQNLLSLVHELAMAASKTPRLYTHLPDEAYICGIRWVACISRLNLSLKHLWPELSEVGFQLDFFESAGTSA